MIPGLKQFSELGRLNRGGSQSASLIATRVHSPAKRIRGDTDLNTKLNTEKLI